MPQLKIFIPVCLLMLGISLQAQTPYAHGASSTIGPEQTRIYFTRAGNSMLVNAEINNRPVTMLFDTGASLCMVGKNHLAELGIKAPEGKAAGLGYGVGSSAGYRVWSVPVTIKVGQLTMSDCPMLVQDQSSTYPLLGQSFFGGYTYSIDDGANCITLQRKVADAAAERTASSEYIVPFVRESGEILVSVQVDGRSCAMYLDTGASQTCFPRGSLRKLNIEVPEDAESINLIGTGGITQGKTVAIRRIKLGPIDRSNVPVTVIDTTGVPVPLLGQPFFSGWEIQIDNVHNHIVFTRR